MCKKCGAKCKHAFPALTDRAAIARNSALPGRGHSRRSIKTIGSLKGRKTMNVRVCLFAGIGAVACLIGSSNLQAHSTTGQVYAILLSGSSVFPASVSSNQAVVGKSSITTANIIDLALGRSRSSPVTANEQLALIFAFSDQQKPAVQLVAYSATGKTTLAVLADQLPGAETIDSVKGKGTSAIGGIINPVGNLTGGWLAMTGKIPVTDAGGIPVITSCSASAVQGVIKGTDRQEFEAIMAKGKAIIADNLGHIVLP
jgi:hypothetical protein